MDEQAYGVNKLLSTEPDQFWSEYMEPKLKATQNIARSIHDQVVGEGLLTPIDGARTVAAALAAIWLQDELIATGSPGPAFSVSEFQGSKQGSKVPVGSR